MGKSHRCDQDEEASSLAKGRSPTSSAPPGIARRSWRPRPTASVDEDHVDLEDAKSPHGVKRKCKEELRGLGWKEGVEAVRFHRCLEISPTAMAT